MVDYTPRRYNGTPEDSEFAQYVDDEFAKVAETLNAPQDFHSLRVLYAAPARPFTGMVVYADGTTWNPGGTGEGIYRYSLAGTWVKLG